MEETWPMWGPDSFYVPRRRGKRYGYVSRLSSSWEQQGTVANNVMRFLFLLTRDCLANFCKDQPDSKYFQPCKWRGLEQFLNFSVIMQNQPQIIRQWMGVAVFQYNLIYGQWNLNFISFILFFYFPNYSKCKKFSWLMGFGPWSVVCQPCFQQALFQHSTNSLKLWRNGTLKDQPVPSLIKTLSSKNIIWAITGNYHIVTFGRMIFLDFYHKLKSLFSVWFETVRWREIYK